MVPIGAALAVNIYLLLKNRSAATRSASDKIALQQSRLRDWSQQMNRLEHDIRTPIGAMAVALELLKTSDDAATRQQATEVLERQVARMTSLTEDLRGVARAISDDAS